MEVLFINTNNVIRILCIINKMLVYHLEHNNRTQSKIGQEMFNYIDEHIRILDHYEDISLGNEVIIDITNKYYDFFENSLEVVDCAECLACKNLTRCSNMYRK